MKLRLLGVIAVTLTALVLGQQQRAASQDKDTGKKRVTVKVVMPQEKATLTIDGVATKQSGLNRTFTSPPLDPKGLFEYTLKATWEPNNYTKITRTHVVRIDVAKDQEVKVDMSKEDKRWKDDIVVRYVPTPDAVVDAMCKLAKVGKTDVVYDLGCGDGRMVCRAIKHFGAKHGVGVDIDPDRVKDSVETAKKYEVEKKVEFRQGDVLKVKDLPDATVVLLYMGTDINHRLKPILKGALKPGSRVVSHRFEMGDDWKPTRTETVTVEGEEYQIHLWVIEGKKGKDKEG